jgi:hypothetical protein
LDLTTSADSTASLRSGLRRSGLSVRELWVAAMGIGGAILPHDIEDITEGDRAATPQEHDVLAAALNDHFTDLGEDHPVARWADLATSA